VLDYVVDFYCPEYKLAVEVIGDVHAYADRERYDSVRSKRIEALGIKILFFTNLEVQEEMNGVLSSILSNLPQNPLLHKEGEAT
jgi:very-short-patch-repair endonuclease